MITIPNFPIPPDWKQVEKFTKIISNIINNNRLSFTEKENILSMVKSVVERDFAMLQVLHFLNSVANKEDKVEKEKLSTMYG